MARVGKAVIADKAAARLRVIRSRVLAERNLLSDSSVEKGVGWRHTMEITHSRSREEVNCCGHRERKCRQANGLKCCFGGPCVNNVAASEGKSESQGHAWWFGLLSEGVAAAPDETVRVPSFLE